MTIASPLEVGDDYSDFHHSYTCTTLSTGSLPLYCYRQIYLWLRRAMRVLFLAEFQSRCSERIRAASRIVDVLCAQTGDVQACADVLSSLPGVQDVATRHTGLNECSRVLSRHEPGCHRLGPFALEDVVPTVAL